MRFAYDNRDFANIRLFISAEFCFIKIYNMKLNHVKLGNQGLIIPNIGL